MKVHLIKEKTVRNYVLANAGSKKPFAEWIFKSKAPDWNSPGDIMDTFRSADLLGNGSFRVIFDIAGNRYPIIGKYGFGVTKVHVFVCWIGTHTEYDKLCKEGKQYTVNVY